MNPKLNLLYISSLYPPYIIGGAEIMASYLAEYLADEGHRVTVISTEDPGVLRGKVFDRCLQNGVEVIRVFPKNLYWIYRKGNPSLISRAFWHARDAWNWDAARKIGQIIAEVRPDIVHTHNIDSFSPAVWYEARKLGIPVVHTAHDLHLLCPRATLLKRNGEACTEACLICKIYRKWHVTRASAIDVFSAPSQLLLNLHMKMGVQAGQFRVVRNGIPNMVSKPEDPVESKDDRMRFLYIGQLTVNKGIHILLEVFRQLPMDIPVILNVAGRGQLEPEIAQAARQDPRINFYGFVSGSKKRELFDSSDFLVLPSIYNDNAPISILEAYNAGVAVIASDIGGLSELVNHRKTGLLFPAGDSQALCSLILELVAQPRFVRELKGGARKISENYTVERMAKHYAEIYHSLKR